MYKQKISMEVNKPYFLPIVMKQYDSDRVLEISLKDKGVNYNLNGKSAKLYGKKADKTIVFKNAEIIDGINGLIRIDFTNNMLASDGINIFELVIIGTEGKILSTIPFSITVIKSVRNPDSDDSIISESTNEITAFEEALANIGEYEANISKFKSDMQALIDNKLDGYKSTFDNYITNMSVSTVKEMREHYNKTYPLGAIYESTDSTSPETLFGGTWEAYGTGCTTVGVGEHTDLNGNTMTIQNGHEYGNYKKSLSIDELPVHSHNQIVTAGTGSDGEILRIDYGSDANGTGAKYEQGVNTGEVGGNKSFDLMQPSIGVYRWRRTALATVTTQDIVEEISDYLVDAGIDFGSYLKRISNISNSYDVDYSYRSGILIRPSTSINYDPYAISTGQDLKFKCIIFNVEKDVTYKITRNTITDRFIGGVYTSKLANGSTPLQILVDDATLSEYTFTATTDGKAMFLLTATNENISSATVSIPSGHTVYKIKPELINNLNRGIDLTWSGWDEKRWSIGGLDSTKASVPFNTEGIINVEGMIVGGGTNTDSRRWGQHVMELYGENGTDRITLLLDRRKGERAEEDGLANTAELYMYLPKDTASVTAETYGWFRIGSDVAKHSVMFTRDKCLSYAELDLRSALTLARINPNTDLDSRYTTVAEADNAYQPERYPVENAKCVRYIQLKNAQNGAMFYDTVRDKVVVKVAGAWCDMNVTPVESGTYDF